MSSVYRYNDCEGDIGLELVATESSSRTPSVAASIAASVAPSSSNASNIITIMELEEEPGVPGTSTGSEMTEKEFKRHAILTVLASFAVTFTACGLNFAFGVYQELYQTMGGPFAGANAAEINLIGTLGVSIMTLGAPFASGWTKKYGPRNVTLLGAAITCLAYMLASVSQTLWQFILTQGLLVGLGTCFSYIPCVTVTPGWFDQRRGLAMGIVLSGTGIGGLVWAPLLKILNTAIGFRNSLRLIGGLGLVMLGGSGYILKWDPRSAHQHSIVKSGVFNIPLVNWNVARGRVFVLKATAATLQAAAYYAPIYYLSTYATSLGYTAQEGANFIALANGLSAGGKIVLGYAADRFGRLNILLLCTSLSAISTLSLWLPSSLLYQRALFIVFTVIYNITAGVYVSLFPTILAELFGVQHFASVNGFLYMLRGAGTIIGTPVAGALISGSQNYSSSPSDYLRSIIFVGVLLSFTSFFVFMIRIDPTKRGSWKA